MTVSLNMPFPVPLASCFIKSKGGGGIPTKRYKAYRANAAQMITAQGSPKVAGPVVVEIELTAPDRRKRDADNLMKCVFDNLVKAGVIEDDNNRVVRAFSVRWVETGRPCYVTIRKVEAGFSRP